MPAAAVAALLLLLLAGCAGRQEPATPDLLAQAARQGFSQRLVAGGPLLVPAWLRLDAPGAPVRAYIEGDGHAWQTRSRPSHDPTPRNPVALRLALADTGANVVYLGRPCQYAARAQDAACHPRLWTSHRYGPDVVRATGAALDTLLAGMAPPWVELVGYSGGGAVALLVAVERPRHYRVTTVAGVLDHAAWTAHHGDTPLDGSLNPADFADRLAAVPQRHFVGLRDTVVPPAVARTYAGRLGAAPCLSVIPVAASHDSGWEAAPIAAAWGGDGCAP